MHTLVQSLKIEGLRIVVTLYPHDIANQAFYWL